MPAAKRSRKSIPQHPAAVLSAQLTDVISCVRVWVAQIIDKKATPVLVKGLSNIQPIFHHLKRVRNQEGQLKIIICLAEGPARECKEKLTSQGVDLTGLDSWENWEETEVSQSRPLTRAQYTAAAKQWPCNFHEDKDIEKLVTCRFFTEDQLVAKSRWMKLAIIASQKEDDLFIWTQKQGLEQLEKDENGLELSVPSFSACTGRMGVVVVNSNDAAIVAASLKPSAEKRPLHHAVMIAIDLVARTQGGGSLPATISAAAPSGQPALDSSSYLCTDCEVYLTHEPCITCCMALLHSRAKTIFFIKGCPGGGLLSEVRLHTLPSINHRFQVFQGFGESF